jgi:hypothetical protein
MALKHTFVSAIADAGTPTIVQPSNWNADHLVDNAGVNITSNTADPTTPATGTIQLFAKKLAGRQLPAVADEFGSVIVSQPHLMSSRIAIWQPLLASGIGSGFGTTWTASGTFTNTQGAPTALANVGAMYQASQYANVITTANQSLGIIATATGLPFTNAGSFAGQGGFYFRATFRVGIYPGTGTRLFVGLTSLATTSVATDITVGANVNKMCALWHGATDTDAPYQLFLLTGNGTTVTKSALLGGFTPGGTGGITQTLRWTMYMPPGVSGPLYYKLEDLKLNTVIVESSTTVTVPSSTATFMGPQLLMSNGANTITANSTAIQVCNVYLESFL